MQEFPYRIIFKYGSIEIILDGDKEFVEKQFLQLKELIEKISERIPIEQVKGIYERVEKISKKTKEE
ncbi:MAG: hypothetical protein NZ891_02865 [bacterium]|nr:hypothetical protein [bacterium]MDW8163665.1 hypothetical protein [Candidatus Omnitrophota bacterium]